MFDKIVKDIKALNIQGAENIAKESIKAIRDVLIKKEDLFSLMIAKDTLIRTRPTEPALRNSLNFLFYNLKENNFKLQLKNNIEKALKHFITSDEKIAKIGANKIRDGMKIYTHCHSNTVMAILKEAKKQGKVFEVFNTETRPKFQGRITAKELTAAGIKVTHYVDSAARIAIKQSDIVFFGADAITTEGNVINKIGSGMFAEIADKYDVPVYCVTNSWKFDPQSVLGFDEVIELRDKNEVWDEDINIKNIAFEEIETKHISGIISELGIYNPQSFILEVERFYSWMFKNS